MSERKYSVREIASLRSAVENKYLYGSYTGGTGMSRTYMASEKENAVEQRVRTHMLAGHTAEDLYASERPSLPKETP